MSPKSHFAFRERCRMDVRQRGLKRVLKRTTGERREWGKEKDVRNGDRLYMPGESDLVRRCDAALRTLETSDSFLLVDHF